MLGRMQDWPLLMHKVIDFAALQFPTREIASRTVEGPMHYTDYRTIRERSLKVAKRLERDGIKLSDRVATLAWNGYRHLEAWYGIAGAGAVYHTVNPRLFPDQIAWIMNDAEDRIVLVDLTFVPLMEQLADRLPAVERYVVLTDGAHMPATKLKNAIAYEDWIGEVDSDYSWKEFDERTAAGLCYTSGTTGNPKGVLYSHRSNLLHSTMASTSACLTVTANDSVLPVVPMFHANSWGLALSCPMRGASMVMPGPRLDGASVYDLLETEKVTMTAAVPTVWLGLLQYLRKEKKTLSTLKFVGIGGSACPPEMIRAFQEDYGVTVRHAWGMTEMSPVGSAGALKPSASKLSSDQRLAIQSKQGWAPFGVEMKIVDDENKELPWDGKRFGRLKVRGFAVVKNYFKDDNQLLDEDGFFDTGDVATIDSEGFMQITDRSKDVIKSGGEWISSIDIENLAVAHPDVAEAAVIGVAHPKWDERPLLVVVAKEGHSPRSAEVLDFLKPQIAKWWMPDDVQVVKEIPHTATGKINKLKLRETFRGYKLPTA
jgi:acyl-CoA synthetase (AMP-forming)/AMP-acid ligase II